MTKPAQMQNALCSKDIQFATMRLANLAREVRKQVLHDLEATFNTRDSLDRKAEEALLPFFSSDTSGSPGSASPARPRIRGTRW